jgi:ubiquinone biosynthesis protein
VSIIVMPPSDLDLGAFSDNAPWVVVPEKLVWRRGLDALRARVGAEAPVLATPPTIPPIGRFIRVTASVGTAIALWYLKERGTPGSRAGISRRLRRSFERLGSTYIKLGQIVSGGDGLFPEELVAEFKLLRDQVPAESFADVRRVVEEELHLPLEAVFAQFDEVPIAAASIAQVHGATLLTGEDVVVKIQRPRIAGLVRQDLAALAWLGPRMVGRIPVAALANPPALVELFAETIVEELDFRLEAENMLDIAAVLAHTGVRNTVVPRPHPKLVTRRVLVMERLSGFNFEDVEGMKRAGIDTGALLRSSLISFLEGALLHGVFHGDLHGGNLFAMPDGRTALLDFGIVARLSPERRQAFLRLMLGAITNDVKAQMAALRDLGALPLDTDLDAVIKDLGLDRPPVDPTTLTGDEMVREVQRVVKALLGYGARMPKELMLYVKNMVFLDGAIARLAPDLDVLAEITSISMLFAQRHGERLGRELGIDPNGVRFDFEGVKAGFGVDPSTDRLTYRELQQRRRLIEKRMRSARS